MAARALRRLAVAAVVAAAAGPQAARGDMNIVAFLDMDPETGGQELYYLHAYRMGFVELVTGDKFASMGPAEAEAAMAGARSGDNAVPMDAALTTEELLGQLPGSGNAVRLLMVDMSDIYAQFKADKNEELHRENTHARMSTVLEAEQAAGHSMFVLGGYSSTRERIKAQWCQDNGVPLVTGGAASASIYEGNPFAFGLLSPVRQLAASTMKFLDEERAKPDSLLPSKVRIALLYEDVPHGISYRDGVAEYAAEHPDSFEVVHSAPFPLDTYTSPDNFTEIDDMRRALAANGGADVLLVDAHSADFRLMHIKLIQEDISFKAITYGARGTDVADIHAIEDNASAEFEFLEDVTSDVHKSLTNLFAGLWWSPGLKNRESQNFVTGWRKHEALLWLHTLDEAAKTGDGYLFRTPAEQLPPLWFGATGYEAMRALVAALRSAGGDGGANSSSVVAALSDLELEDSILPGGWVRFDENGQVYGDFTIAQNQEHVEDGHDGSHLTLHPFIVYPDVAKTSEFQAYEPFTSPRPACAPRFWREALSGCTATNEHVLSYSYVKPDGSPCAFTQDAPSCFCDSDKKPKPQPWAVDCRFVNVGSAEASAAITLGYLGITASALVLVLVLLSWTREELRGAQKVMLLLIAISGAWNCGVMLLLQRDNTAEKCKSRVVQMVLSQGLMLSLLLGRVVTWYRIWVDAKQSNLHPSPLHVAAVPVAFMTVFGVLTGVWVAVQDSFVGTMPLPGVSDQVAPVPVCIYTDENSAPVLVVVATVGGAMLFMCLLLAYQAKDCDGRYFESWYLWVAAFNIVFVYSLIAVFLGLADLGTINNILITSLGLFINSSVFLIGTVVPRILAVYGIQCFESRSNPSSFSTADQTSDSQSVMRKYIRGRARRRTSQATEYS